MLICSHLGIRAPAAIFNREVRMRSWIGVACHKHQRFRTPGTLGHIQRSQCRCVRMCLLTLHLPPIRFDYGEFREIAALATSSAAYDTFAFVFEDAGTYVFSSSCNPASIIVVAVMGSDVRCVEKGCRETRPQHLSLLEKSVHKP